MKFQLSAMLLALALPARGAVVEIEGRDVTVALFTTQDLRAVVLTPLAPGAWTATCATCPHKPLTAPLTLSSGELYASGTLRVADAANHTLTSTASGKWHMRGSTHGVDVVLTIPSERYTAAVVSAEVAAHEPEESLRALAIVARTYALNGSHYHAGAGHLPADLCDSTQCQALRLGQVSTAINNAVSATAGETLWFGNKRAEVFFSQHCGGITADESEAWAGGKGMHTQPYLRSHVDAFCLRRGPAAWHASLSLDELKAVAQREGWRLPTHITSATIAQRTGSGRTARLLFHGASGDTSTLNANALRFGVGRALGWNRIRSDLYNIALRDNALIFDGRGHGHGVGLCQAGATEMAIEHRDARAILAFYFPGTHIRILPNDDGWMATHVGPIRVRSTNALSAETRDALTRSWQDALRQFPVAKAPEPLVVVASSTEMFRQMTGQPGWDLASTRGNVVTLQPEQILRKPRQGGGNEESTLRHELLHALIESEATDRAPLWLREGLAEALSDTLPVAASNQTSAELDAMLQHADSFETASTAHRLAGIRVRALTARYGFSAVRSWLKSGVPASVDVGK
jgi:stage II sporulation protein D